MIRVHDLNQAASRVQDAACWIQEGNLRLKEGSYQEALECYSKGVNVSRAGSQASKLYTNRARVHIQLGNWSDAFADCEKAIKHDAHNPKAYWGAAMSAIRMLQYSKARIFCLRGLAALGPTPSLEKLLAQADEALLQQDKDMSMVGIVKETKAMDGKDCTCAICLACLDSNDSRIEATITLPCHHVFHKDCVNEMRRQGATEVCPLCRAAGFDELRSVPNLVDEALTLFVRADVGGTGKELVALEAAQRFKEILEIDSQNCVSLSSLAFLHHRGLGVRLDKKKAVKLWEQAALQDLPDAKHSLGKMYNYGDGVRQDKSKAAELWKEAASKGHQYAQFELGVLYASGEGVPQNKVKAAKLWEKAASQGHPGAQNNLGLLYNDGHGVARDKRKAIELWQLAADQGDPDAQNNLASKYKSGDGLPRDKAKAAELWETAAANGHANAQFSLGLLYNEGDGKNQDKGRAVQLWKLAAGQGHAYAQFNLGVLYANGDGVQADQNVARDLWMKAATQGHPRAQSYLGSLRTSGLALSGTKLQINTVFEMPRLKS